MSAQMASAAAALITPKMLKVCCRAWGSSMELCKGREVVESWNKQWSWHQAARAQEALVGNALRDRVWLGGPTWSQELDLIIVWVHSNLGYSVIPTNLSHRACPCVSPIGRGFCIIKGEGEEERDIFIWVKANKLWQVLKQKDKGKVQNGHNVSRSILQCSSEVSWFSPSALRSRHEHVHAMSPSVKARTEQRFGSGFEKEGRHALCCLVVTEDLDVF